MPHAHVNAMSLAVIVALLIVVNFAGRTWASHHADSPWARGLAYVL